MAVGETARLLATLELKDKFSKPASDAERALGGLERKTGTLGKIGQEASRGLGNAINNLKTIGMLAAGAIAANVTVGLQSLVKLEELENQTTAVIESTGGAANVTAAQVRTMSEELERLSTVDDKVIQNGANLLLTFTQIRNEVGEGNDVFDQGVEAALNMSVAMGSDLNSAIIQVGKALNDPIRGVTALRRVGVQLTEQQEKQIKTFVEAGDVMSAQKIILAELETQFGGTAAAFGTGTGAAMRRAQDAIEDAQMALATGFLPLIEKGSRFVQDLVADPAFQKGITQFGEGLAEGIEDLIDIGTRLPWGAIGDAAKLMGEGARWLLESFKNMPPWVQTAVLTGWGLNKLTGGALGNIVGELGKGLVRGVLGMNAGVVNARAGVVNVAGAVPGGGAPVAAAGRAGGASVLGTLGFAGIALAIGTAVGSEVHAALRPTEHSFNELASQIGKTKFQVDMDVQGLASELGKPVDAIRADMIPLLERGNMTWDEIVATVRAGNTRTEAQNRTAEAQRAASVKHWERMQSITSRAAQTTAAELSQTRARTEAARAAIERLQSPLGGIGGAIRELARKPTIVNANVTVNTSVNARMVQQSTYRSSAVQSATAGVVL